MKDIGMGLLIGVACAGFLVLAPWLLIPFIAYGLLVKVPKGKKWWEDE